MDTIFAPITSQASSAVMVIRISGEKALEALRILGVKSTIIPRKSTFAAIFNPENGEVIDEALFTYFKAPHSFTGEDVIEIGLHSSSFILKKISQIFLAQPNFRFAEAGEFSKRAFLNGKIDLVQAEAIPDLIRSESEAAHRQAINQLQGKLGKIYENWRKKIIEIMAMIAALIDFPDEDIPAEIAQKIADDVKILSEEIISHLNDNRAGQKIKNGILVAIIGEPNVGKSSLLNFLADSEVAIVSKHAGTTRDVIEVRLEIAGIMVNFADTAGIRQSKDEIEQEGIRRAIKKAKEADIKILMIDANSLKANSAATSLDLTAGLEIDERTILVVNKIDDLAQDEEFLRTFLKSRFGKSIAVSITKEINLRALLSAIEGKIKEILPNQNLNFLTQERYRHYLENAAYCLSQFSMQKNIELSAEDLRVAALEIGKINGKIDIEDILDSVFSSFCIGK